MYFQSNENYKHSLSENLCIRKRNLHPSF